VTARSLVPDRIAEILISYILVKLQSFISVRTDLETSTRRLNHTCKADNASVKIVDTVSEFASFCLSESSLCFIET